VTILNTGCYVGAEFRNGSTTTIRGAFVANEAVAGAASGFFEFLMDDNTTFSVRNTKQNLRARRTW
jgi:hypothetical protein